MDEIDDLKNATVFVPTDEALEEEGTKKLIEEFKSDKKKLKDIIMYHILPGKTQSCDLNNNEMKDTSMEGQKLRVNLYSTVSNNGNI